MPIGLRTLSVENKKKKRKNFESRLKLFMKWPEDWDEATLWFSKITLVSIYSFFSCITVWTARDETSNDRNSYEFMWIFIWSSISFGSHCSKVPFILVTDEVNIMWCQNFEFWWAISLVRYENLLFFTGFWNLLPITENCHQHNISISMSATWLFHSYIRSHFRLSKFA